MHKNGKEQVKVGLYFDNVPYLSEAISKTIFPVYYYKNATLDQEKVRAAIIEVYGENMFTEYYAAAETDDNKKMIMKIKMPARRR